MHGVRHRSRRRGGHAPAVATDRLAITGMHLHFPGFAHLVRRGSSYQFIPEAWEQTL
jgi:hypothetical protein